MTLPIEMQAARLQILRKNPYLASAVWAMHPVSAPGLGTMAVDQYYRLYYDPTGIAEWSVDELAGVIQHEVAHLMRLHFVRMSGYKASIANLAADAEINDNLLEEGIKLPLAPVTPTSLGQPNGLLAEEYYAALLSARNNSNAGNEQPPSSGSQSTPGDAQPASGDQSAPGAGRCGSCATGTPEPWELASPAESGVHGINQSQAELIRRDVANRITASTPGTVAGHWKRWADEILSPKINWRKELAVSIRNAIATIAGGVDYSYSRPSRRQGTQTIILPSMRQPIPEVAVVIDTSGSIGGEMLSQALAEVSGILKTCGLRQGVTVLSVDTQVQTSSRVFDARQIKLRGGGGTDMGAGLTAAVKLMPRPQLAIVLTDGYTPWPTNKPSGLKHVIIGLLDEGTVSSPSWAKNIQIRF